MGILDDAIREHLDLKRQHGADDTDLERLEKEAFGPPSRPGDPEFADDVGGFADHGDEEGSEDPTSFMPSEPAMPTAEDDPMAVAPPEADIGSDLPPVESELAAEAAPAAKDVPQESDEDWLSGVDSIAAEETALPEGELSGAERARIDHADLDDTVDHPTVTDGGSEQPPEPPESAIFDQGEEGEEPDAEAQGEESDQGEAPTELRLDDEDEDLELTLPDDSATEHELPEIPADGEEGSDDEDLLEETPDFLQDAPEGERLWFEQGEPKDFDFDDDDDD
jgi:hypothetical protein